MMYIRKFAWFQPQELHTKRKTNRAKNAPTNSITQLASKSLTSYLNLKSKFCAQVINVSIYVNKLHRFFHLLFHFKNWEGRSVPPYKMSSHAA